MRFDFEKELMNDEYFRSEMLKEIDKVLSQETLKSDDEMDLELIDDCVDAMLYLKNYDTNSFALTPKIVKKFHTKLQLSRMFKGMGTLVAVLVIAVVVMGVYKNVGHETYIAPPESVETTTQVQTTAASSENGKEEPTTTAKTEKNNIVLNNKTSKTAKASREKRTTKTKKADNKKTTSKKTQPTQKNKATTVPSKKTTPSEPTTKKADAQKRLVSLECETQKGFKKVYFIGESFDPYGINVTAVYSDSSTENISIDKCSIYGFDSSSAGKRTVVIAYENQSCFVSVTVAQ